MNTKSSLYKELTNTQIANIVKKTFGDVEFSYELKEGGLFNTTYVIALKSRNQKYILRVGPVNRELLISYEETLMQGEEYVYKILKGQGIICPEIVATDFSEIIVPRCYMITKYIKSVPMSDESVTPEEKPILYSEVGEYASRLHEITGLKFGRAAEIAVGGGYESFFEYILSEFSHILSLLKKSNGISEAEAEQVLFAIIENSGIFHEITTPYLCHADLWDGNILVSRDQNGTPYVSAVIDADRAVFGDKWFDAAMPWIESAEYKEHAGMPPTDKNSVLRQRFYLILMRLTEAYIWHCEYNDNELYESCKKEAFRLLSGV